MNNIRAFTLVLNSKKHIVPSINIFEHIKKIPTNISDALVFEDHIYVSKAKVSDAVSQSFIEYLIKDTKPDIGIDNYHEYLELSQEFNLMSDFIEEKEQEWGEDLQYFSGLHQSSNPDKSIFETKISQQLDYYLERYSENFMKEPIDILSNIFFNKERKLTKHNLAYELINMHYKNTGDSNIFVLYSALDGKKLNEENLEESIRLKTARGGFIPKFEYSYLTSKIDEVERNEERINNLEEETKRQKSTISNLYEEITNIQKEHSKEIDDLKTIIQTQNSEINTIKSELLNEMKTMKSEFEKQIESIKSDCLDEIKSFQTKCENEMKSNESNHKTEIQTIKSGYEKEIENLRRTIDYQKKEIETMKSKQTQENNSMKGTFENKMKEIENKTEREMNLLKTQQEDRFDSFKTEMDEMKSFLLRKIIESTSKSNSIEPSHTENGILYSLKTNSPDLFDPPFIASQSSNDIYNLIDPNSKDLFSTNGDEGFFIKFELKESATINGIKIYSYNEFYPKSFNIEIEGEVVKSIKEAKELNGEFKEMTINFPTKSGKVVRFIQTGPNWDKGTNFLNIKRIELLSPEPKYSKGIFSTLIEESKRHDPHKCGVHISSTWFDFNSFHLIDAKLNIWTFHEDNSWFQIELTRGFVIITGFRLKRGNPGKMKSYKIIASDSNTNSIETWTELIQINEEREDEHKTTGIYSFLHPSPPIRFIRIVQTGPRWDNKKALLFYHFEIFGTYI